MYHLNEEKIKEILLEAKLVSETEFEEAKSTAFRFGQSIPSYLVGQGIVPEAYMTELLEQYFLTPIIDLTKVVIPSEVIERIPEAFAKTKNVVLFAIDEKNQQAKLAMLDPFDYDTIEFVRANLDMWVEPYLTTTTSLKYGTRQYKKKIGEEFSKIISDNIEKTLSLTGSNDVAKMVEAIPIVTILNSVLEHAATLGASDIHFEPLEKEVLIRYRVDGILHEILSLPKVIAPILVARVKVLANLLIDEHKVPQDGRFRFDLEDGNIDLRVNVMPVFHGEKVEMRLLKGNVRLARLEDLGLSDKIVTLLKEEIKKPHGMILVTGPTGHGKTTTLYTLLHLLNTPKVNITTIEDPIEYEVERVNQTQVNTKAGVTFANGLRSLLRQNPDIIMVGEIRDNETADISVHAALTGHLVLSTLHTNDAPTAVPRLLDMGAAAFLLASTLNLVIAQRLVRKICSSCVESYAIDAQTKKIIEQQIKFFSASHAKTIPKRLFRGRGCKVCNGSGFHGQVGLFEVMPTSDALRTLIIKNSSGQEIRRQAIKEGMITLFEDGLDKIGRGITTVEEVVRVVSE